jgi:hypothetical protein
VSADSSAAIRDGLGRAGWGPRELWVASIGIGGAFDPADVAGIADGTVDPTPLEHDILAAALNDHFVDRGGDHPVRYWRELATPGRRP